MSFTSAVAWLLVAAATLGCTRPNPRYMGPRNRADASTPDAGNHPTPASGGAEPEAPDDAAPDQVLPPPPPPDTAVQEPETSAPEVTAELAPPPPDLAAPMDTTPPMVSADRLVAHFPLSGPTGSNTITDARGSRITLSATTWVTDAPAGFPSGAQSLSFNGTSSFATISMLPTWPTSRGEKTMALWYRKKGSPQRLGNLITLKDFDEPRYVGVQLGFDNNALAAWRFGAGGAEMVAGTPYLDSWHHAAYTYVNGTGRLYLDGVQMTTSGLLPADQTAPLDTAYLGTYDNSPLDELFQGLLTDVRIYNRALGPDEIAILAGK